MNAKQKLVLRPPCAECPFLKKALPGWLGTETPEEVWARAHGDDPFGYPCHMDADDVAAQESNGHRDKSWRQKPGSVEQCTGALLHASKTGKMFADPWREAARQVLKALFPNASIMGIEFMKHHKGK